MSFDPTDAFIGGVSSNCCGAAVLIGDMCAECHEHCEAESDEEEDESQEGPSDALQELWRASAEAADIRYRQQMKDAGRGHLLPP